MKRKLLAFAAVPMAFTLMAAYDAMYVGSGYGELNVWAGGGSASAYARTTAYASGNNVSVSVSLTPRGSGCSGWVTSSNSGVGYTEAYAYAPAGCSATEATAAAYHTIYHSNGFADNASTYITQ